MKPYGRGLKFAVIFGVIALVVTVFVASFPLPHFWAIITIVIIISGGAFFYFLPQISSRIGVRSPFFDKRKIQTIPTTHEPPVVIYNQEGLITDRPWPKIFRETQREIMIQGISLESLDHFRTHIETAAKQGKRVRILVCRPKTSFMTGIETVVVSTDTKSRIQSLVNMMYLSRDKLGSSDVQNLEIKWHEQIPTMTMVIADDCVQIEPYPYKTPQDKRKTLMINRDRQKELYDVYREAFENLWKDATPAERSTPKP